MKIVETIAFKMDEDFLKDIETKMLVSGIYSKKQYFEYALALFGWAIEASKSGRIIAAVDVERNVYRELEMAPLDAVRNLKNDVKDLIDANGVKV